MLQQTQVATVIEYFNRWMDVFPNVERLAQASEETVLKHWAGLGYYSRARNLHAAARLLAQRFSLGETWPSLREEWRALPGVGDYTSGAVLALAFNQPQAFLDGNILRVLSRFHGISEPALAHQQAYRSRAEEWMNRTHPGDTGEALMELGARVCTPTSPVCLSCPVQSGCKASHEGRQAEWPPPKKKPVWQVQTGQVWIFQSSGQQLLVRSSQSPFLKGHWSYPTSWRGILELSPPASFTQEDKNPSFKKLGKVKHTITRNKIDLEVQMIAVCPSKPLKMGLEWELEFGLDPGFGSRMVKEKKPERGSEMPLKWALAQAEEWEWVALEEIRERLTHSLGKKIHALLP
jgi:A/G-specific adenine glycosylase